MSKEYITLGLACGIGCLLYAQLFWNHSPKSQKNFVLNWRCEITSFLVVIGFMLLIYTSLEGVILYKHHFKNFLNSGSSNNIKFILGALGFVMTITTVGVITLSRNALTDIREERKAISEELQAMQDTLNPLPYKLQLELKRQNLVYHNNEELMSLRRSTFSSKREDKIQFRMVLKTMYAEAETDVLEFLNYINIIYEREKHDRLLGAEIDYLQQIMEHYKQYPSADKVYSKKIIELSTDILKK